jgi:hypothetical protein
MLLLAVVLLLRGYEPKEEVRISSKGNNFLEPIIGINSYPQVLVELR